MIQPIFVLISCLLISPPVQSLRLSRSSQSSSGGRSFPEDIFASPAYQINWNAEPITNSSALHLIEQEDLAWKRWKESSRQREKGKGREVEMGIDVRNGAGDQSQEIFPPSSTHYLLRPSESVLYLCSISSSFSPESSASTSSSKNIDRASVLQSGLTSLEPLKKQCLYRTIDWFTYSFCHGAEIKQFRALAGTNIQGRTPAPDPKEESYVLGRFSPNSEKVYGSRSSDDKDVAGTSLSSTSNSDAQVYKEKTPEQIKAEEEEEDGAELVEVMRFSGSGDDLAERYLSQKWGGGTRCDITTEPRETEVQFHCNSKIPQAKISLIKETTTCAYVMIIETPKLCSTPAFSVGKEEEVSEIACRAIVPDGWKKGEGEIASDKWSPKDQAGAQVIDAKPEISNVASADGKQTQQAASGPASEQTTTQSTSAASQSQSEKPSTESSSEGGDNLYVIAVDQDGNYVVESVQDAGNLENSIFKGIEEMDLEEALELMFDPADFFMGDQGDQNDAGGNGQINGEEPARAGDAPEEARRGLPDQLASLLEKRLNERDGKASTNQDESEARRRVLRQELEKLNNILGKVADLGKEDGAEVREEERNQRDEKLGETARSQWAARKGHNQDSRQQPTRQNHKQDVAQARLTPQGQVRRNSPEQQLPLQPKSMKKEPETFAERVGRMYKDKEEKEKGEKQKEERRHLEL